MEDGNNMSQEHGAYGQSDATQGDQQEQLNKQEQSRATARTGRGEGAATNAQSAVSGSTDATLNARRKSNDPNRKPWLWIAIAAIVVIAVVVSIVVFRQRTSDSNAQQADTVTVGLTLAPTNLDIRNQSGSALDQVLIGNVYEGLVARDSENKVVPSIASSWDISSDGLTYTFHLNSGMTFSNGDELDATDVAWSINELIDNQYHDYNLLQNVSSVEATDSKTVTITLDAPYANLLWALAGRPGLVFDTDASYDAKTQAIGSGPYVVDSFEANTSITLKANSQYWGEHKAKTPTVVVRYLTDANAGLNALTSGDLQVLAPVSENLADGLRKQSDKYTVTTGEDTDKFVLAMNQAQGRATTDIRIRQAMRYAIDHHELIASRGGADAPLGGPIPSLDPGYEDLTDLYPHDVDKAKQLMEETGYTTDNPLKLTLTYANIYSTELGDQLKSSFKEIGIDLQVNIVEFSTWLQDVYTNHDYDLSLVDHNESHDFSQWTDPTYYYGYDNSEVQDLYKQAMAATNENDTDAYLAQAARIVSEDAAADWLFNYRITTATAAGVEGFPVNLNQTLMPLYDVTYTRQ